MWFALWNIFVMATPRHVERHENGYRHIRWQRSERVARDEPASTPDLHEKQPGRCKVVGARRSQELLCLARLPLLGLEPHQEAGNSLDLNLDIHRLRPGF